MQYTTKVPVSFSFEVDYRQHIETIENMVVAEIEAQKDKIVADIRARVRREIDGSLEYKVNSELKQLMRDAVQDVVDIKSIRAAARSAMRAAAKEAVSEAMREQAGG